MRVVTYRSVGKTYWSIANDQYVPLHSVVSYYLQVKLGGKSVNTRERRAYELLFSLKYFQQRNIDLIGDVESFNLLSEKEINLFARSCKLKAHVVENQTVESISSRAAISNLIARNHPIRNIVSEGTANGRLDTFIDFYQFVWNRIHGRSVLTTEQEIDYDQCLIYLNIAKESMGSWTIKISDPHSSNLSDEKYFELLDMVRVSSDNNPFINSKFRNELIIKLCIETGLRRGAVAKLKISDLFNDRNPRVRVTKTPDDSTDIRRDRASQKTKPHVSPISSDLAKMLEFYIKEVRNTIPNTDEHEFIFVTEKDSKGTLGQPLTLRSYNSIFNKLGKALNEHLSPHVLRHKWNELFDDDMSSLARELGFDSKTIEDIRKYAMGWSAKSEMADIYNNFKLLSKTRDYHLARQREMEKRIKRTSE